MKYITLVLLTLIFISGCKKETTPEPNNNISSIPNKNLPPNIKIPNLKKYFDDANMKGCIVIYDEANKTYAYYDSARCYKGFLPASTFKIPNSLFALEAGVVKDENEKLKWDGTVRKMREEWNQDTDMRMAFKYSTVWYYQEVARRIGMERMKHFMDTLNYGNKNISRAIDRFWLEGPLRISAMEQLSLLMQIAHSKVPFSQRNIDILQSIMIQEENPKYVFRGKTGTAVGSPDSGDEVGWFVGYLTTEHNIYYYALNVDINESDFKFNERLELPRKIFNDMGLTKFEVQK